VSTVGIIGIVIGIGFVLVLVYALIRIPRRMGEGEMESAGPGSDAWKREYEDPPPS
jgi:hypothetical protein